MITVLPKHALTVIRSEIIRFFAPGFLDFRNNTRFVPRFVHFKSINNEWKTTDKKNPMSEQIRRKSPLLVSVTIGSLADKFQEVEWPALSQSEKSTKARRTSSDQRVDTCCAARQDFASGKTDDSENIYKTAREQESSELLDDINANLSATWTLQRSSNLCSLILKENQGCESWRDLL
jgi:hypothetical protein